MKWISKITRNFQITIPKELREELGIGEGDYVVFEIDGDAILMTPARLVKRDEK